MELTVHVIGTPRVSRAGLPLPLTRKAAALLIYLALERRPVHRSTVASLFWPGDRSLGSLRVELTKLRQHGIDLAPQREPLLRFHTPTDLERLAQHSEVSLAPASPDARLLDGFDDDTTPALQAWAREKRKELGIRQQALHRPGPPGETGALIASAVTWLAAQLAPPWQAAVRQAATQPPVLLVAGRDGDGTREALSTLLDDYPDTAVLQLDAVADPQVFLSALLLRLSPLLGAQTQAALRRTLTRTSTPDALQRALVAHLLQLPEVLTVVVHRVGPDISGLEPLLQLLPNWPLPLVTVLVTRRGDEPALARQLAGRLGPRRVHRVRTPDLCSAALGDDPQRWATHLRHCEGHLGALTALLEHPDPLPLRVRLSPELSHALHSSVDQTVPGQLDALARLAGLRAPFTSAQALAALPGPSAEDILRRAVSSGILEHVPPTLRAQWPALAVRGPDDDHPLAFQSELTRSALAATLDAASRVALRHAPPVLACLPQGLEIQGGVVKAQAPERGTFQRGLQFPGGYRAEQWTCGLSVLRLGAAGHAAPVLHLLFPPQARPALYRVDELEGLDDRASLQLCLPGDRRVRLPTPRGQWLACPVPNDGPWTLEVEARHLSLQIALNPASAPWEVQSALSKGGSFPAHRPEHRNPSGHGGAA